VIRILAVAAALAGAILLAPGAQAQPHSSTGPGNCNSVANGAGLSCGFTVAGAANKFVPTANKFVPTITATPFGSAGTFSDQPGLVIANANGNSVVPTGIPSGYPTPMVQGNMVGPATTTTPLSGGIRTRHGMGTSLFGVLGRLFG
jgi:hypothetical protein